METFNFFVQTYTNPCALSNETVVVSFRCRDHIVTKIELFFDVRKMSAKNGQNKQNKIGQCHFIEDSVD